jgi:xylose isomerase
MPSQSLGAGYQLLIEPKPREPSGHQYDYDAQTTIGFLKHYGECRGCVAEHVPAAPTLPAHSPGW